MKLRHTAVLATLTLSLLGGAGVAAAQENTDPTCAQAISVYIDARAALDKLPKNIDNPELVKLAEAVEKATTTRDQRKEALVKANAAVVSAESGNTSGAITARAAVVDRIAELRRFIADEKNNPADQRALAQRQLDARQAQLAAIDALASAETALANATKAQQDAPRRIDNPALKSGPVFDAMVKAQTAADKACEGQPNDPGPVDDNPGDDQGNDDNGSDNGGTDNGGGDNGNVDNGGSDNGSTDNGLNPGPITSTNGESVFVPAGGVETGGGPA